MNSQIKSIFIILFPLLVLVALIDSIWYLSTTGIVLQHVAHLVTAASIVFFFVKVFMKPVARTDNVLQVYTFIIFLGCLLGLLAEILQKTDTLRVSCLLFNIVLTFCWILYLVWYSFYQKPSAEHTIRMKIGNVLPLLTFEDHQTGKITSDTFANAPSIFIFYRGNWCPFCMAQIKEMVSYHKELIRRNINTIFVSSQPRNFSKNLTKKYPLDFKFLVDVDGKAAKELHIFDANGLPFGFHLFGFGQHSIRPTVIITDANKKIIYANQTENYRIRPEPTTLLKIIDDHK